MAQCKFDDCSIEQKYLTRGYCKKHYYRSVKYGDASIDKMTHRRAIVENSFVKIPIGVNAKHGYALVDKEFKWLEQYSWTMITGYATTTINKKTVLMHKMLLPTKLQVDHINMNKLDNRLLNLRPCTDGQNKLNRAKYSNNTSGYKGVEYISKTGKYRARVRINGLYHHAGMFKTVVEAAKAYNEKAKTLHGEFVRLNDV